MKSNRVMLRVEEFRAISKAEIKLDGITVVAGVNGCGKSTLSKLLYWVYRGATDFEVLAKIQRNKNSENIKLMLSFLFSQLSNIFRDNSPSSITKENLDEVTTHFALHSDLVVLSMELSHLTNNFSKEKLVDFFPKIKDFLIKIDSNFSQNQNEIFFNMMDNLLPNNDIFAQKLKLLQKDKLLTPLSVLDLIISYTDYIYDKYQQDLILKPRNLAENKVQQIFNVSKLPDKLEISENQGAVFSSNNEYLGMPYWINNIIYIDTPMFFSHYEEEHWADANEKLKQRPKLNEKPKPIQEIDDLIKRQIFRNGAEVKFDELSESFTFRTSSGVEMDLSDSATGMKTFAVLDRLVKNGSINKKTLLILDEPEAHLHPQWIVELGRLLTLINKHIGAKIFVATHSPDMVQALRYIPNKEKIGDNVNFYLAEFNQENGLFDYKDLNGKVGEIFTSFNKSLDKLEEYGDEA